VDAKVPQYRYCVYTETRTSPVPVLKGRKKRGSRDGNPSPVLSPFAGLKVALSTRGRSQKELFIKQVSRSIAKTSYCSIDARTKDTKCGGIIGGANQSLALPGWQQVRGRRLEKRPQGASTGTSPAKPDAQRRAVQEVERDGGGSIAMVQQNKDGAAVERMQQDAAVAAAESTKQFAEVVAALETPSAARRARAVGGSIVAAASNHDASTNLGLRGWPRVEREGADGAITT
jgi:hypothetical protein